MPLFFAYEKSRFSQDCLSIVDIAKSKLKAKCVEENIKGFVTANPIKQNVLVMQIRVCICI